MSGRVIGTVEVVEEDGRVKLVDGDGGVAYIVPETTVALSDYHTPSPIGKIDQNEMRRLFWVGDEVEAIEHDGDGTITAIGIGAGGRKMISWIFGEVAIEGSAYTWKPEGATKSTPIRSAAVMSKATLDHLRFEAEDRKIIAWARIHDRLETKPVGIGRSMSNNSAQPKRTEWTERLRRVKDVSDLEARERQEAENDMSGAAGPASSQKEPQAEEKLTTGWQTIGGGKLTVEERRLKIKDLWTFVNTSSWIFSEEEPTSEPGDVLSPPSVSTPNYWNQAGRGLAKTDYPSSEEESGTGEETFGNPKNRKKFWGLEQDDIFVEEKKTKDAAVQTGQTGHLDAEVQVGTDEAVDVGIQTEDSESGQSFHTANEEGDAPEDEE